MFWQISKKQGTDSKGHDFGYESKSVLCRMEISYFLTGTKKKKNIFFCGTPCIVLLVNGMA